MKDARLKIGQINYLNVLPLFHHLQRIFLDGEGVEYVRGHPAELNDALAAGTLDLAPASAFEYLRDAERYRLLPELSITASHGPIKSVLLVSPVPLAELPGWMAEHGPDVNLTSASASSTALLKVLWKFHWKLPEATWHDVEPGAGLAKGRPFLEIGNKALQLYLDPPKGWHLIDLADAWRDHTGLPFVFAVWIVRRGLTEAQNARLADVHTALLHCKTTCVQAIAEVSQLKDISSWINPHGVEDYLSTMGYDLGPEEKASLTLFGDACRRLGLIPGTPGLEWAL